MLIILAIFAIAESERLERQSRYRCNNEETMSHPHHCHLLGIAATNPEKFAAGLRDWAKKYGSVVVTPDRDTSTSIALETKRNLRNGHNTHEHGASNRGARNRPIVLAHGMGDSCFNDGLKHVTERITNITGAYSTCIPTGDNFHDDTINGYFKSWYANVDIFAEKIKNDPLLEDGFDAIGFSQGNNIIRGYIARFNDPPVKTFISINGVNAGIAAVPRCIPKFETVAESGEVEPIDQLNFHHHFTSLDSEDLQLDGKICNYLMEIASHKAYSDFSQTHSFQANYWRDPRPSERANYQKYSQLARISNEVPVMDTKLNENYAKTEKFVWVKATKDTIVWPIEGEQWGAPNSDADDPFSDILPMDQTDWYKSDLFGLRTADEEGRNYYEQFDGDHLAFSWDDFDAWVAKYLDAEH